MAHNGIAAFLHELLIVFTQSNWSERYAVWFYLCILRSYGLMEKINWKILNSAFWIEIILSYILPFKVVNHFQYNIGWPIQFISVYDSKPVLNPLMSMSLNPLGLLLNGVIIYWAISVAVKAYNKLKYHETK